MRSIYLSFAISFSLIGLIPVGASAQGGLATRVARLEAQVAAMEAILESVRVESEPINGLRGPHWIFEGVNVHVRSGSGSTYDRLCPNDPDCVSGTGLGNLVVGYNEGFPSQARVRRGMHNLVVGPKHAYIGSGGARNDASGPKSSVSGGGRNEASGINASVSGGGGNFASAFFSSVSGGRNNEASALASSVSGGLGRTAPADDNWAAGSLLEQD